MRSKILFGCLREQFPKWFHADELLEMSLCRDGRTPSDLGVSVYLVNPEHVLVGRRQVMFDRREAQLLKRITLEDAAWEAPLEQA